MKIKMFADSDIPSFCWDRPWSFGVIKEKLKMADEQERINLISWILREGSMDEIWNLLTPHEIFASIDKILPFLGRKKEYWRYTFNVWHQLGKI
jgi:hypothetical protein